ncbi:hypothetical protein LDENG_00193810, partial [Lucifuga dentata]
VVLQHIKARLQPTFQPHQFTYRPNRSTEDAITTALHLALSHLEHQGSYVRTLFVDFSSAFNTIIPSRLVTKLLDLGLPHSTCRWIKDFLTDCPRLSDLAPTYPPPSQAMCEPLFYAFYTYDCITTHSSSTIIKFTDDMTVVGLISRGDGSVYRDEV